MTQKIEEYDPYETIIRKVKEKIKNNQDRVFDKAWQYPVPTDDWAYKLFTFSSNADDADIKTLEAQYLEEYKAITETLYELGLEPKQIWGNNGVDNKEKVDKFFEQMEENLRFSNQALSVWKIICKPIRIKGNKVYLLSNSSGLGVEPYIRVNDVNTFINNSIYLITEDNKEITLLKKKVEQWQIITFILGFIAFITIMIIL